MAIALAPLNLLKFPIAYLNSPTRKPYPYAKSVSISCTKLKSLQFWLILSKFGCHGNSLASLKIVDSIFDFPQPENPTIHVNIVLVSCTELKSVQFWLILPKFGCHSNPIGSLEIVLSYLNWPTPKTLLAANESIVISECNIIIRKPHVVCLRCWSYEDPIVLCVTRFQPPRPAGLAVPSLAGGPTKLRTHDMISALVPKCLTLRHRATRTVVLA